MDRIYSLECNVSYVQYMGLSKNKRTKLQDSVLVRIIDIYWYCTGCDATFEWTDIDPQYSLCPHCGNELTSNKSKQYKATEESAK